MINLCYMVHISFWSLGKPKMVYQRSTLEECRNDGRINNYSQFACYRLKHEYQTSREIETPYRNGNYRFFGRQKMDII